MDVHTVSRNDSVYECFPDIARTCDGRMICVYRESEAHTPVSGTRIVVRTSEDDGVTWTDPCTIVESAGAVQRVAGWNCPRISQMPDGRIALACDRLLWPEGKDLSRRSSVHLWWSEDGERWRGPDPTGAYGIVPDKPLWTSHGVLMGTHDCSPRTGGLRQLLWRQGEDGSWSGPVTVAEEPGLNLCEGSLLQGSEALACVMRENSGQGLPGHKALSRDGGATWQKPIPAQLPGCHRPVAGWWAGEVLVTYRCHMGRGASNTLFMGAIMDPEAVFSSRPAGRTRIFPIDYDRSPTPDTGYSGWVALGDGSVYMVNYIVDDAPKAQIRGYRIRAEDVCLN